MAKFPEELPLLPRASQAVGEARSRAEAERSNGAAALLSALADGEGVAAAALASLPRDQERRAARYVAHMTHVDEQGRPEPPLSADEVTMLKGFLDWQRSTLLWKCRGLDATGLNTKIAGSSLTLGGLLKHMALVEDSWFSWNLHGEAPAEPWSGVDFNSDPDWEFSTAADDTPDELFAMWKQATEGSNERITRAIADGGLDMLAKSRGLEDAPSLRWIMIHMIEEYARHNGHADLLRESIDGEVGE